ncbi:hypothetical protein [Arenimonas daejeonensis]|uniref:hypothetical protein n=1 Tax=Arenimonas daejeonensis TaxID=370777 RepID=UPI00131512BF|nr:hypothetical protein [Arenimonas daejeonensis]
MTSSIRPPWTYPTLALLVAITVLVFYPGLGGDFIFDDFANIVSNKKVHAESWTGTA